MFVCLSARCAASWNGMRARDSLGAFAGISRFAWFRMDEQYRYEAGAWGACDVVVDSPWFVLVSTAPGDRRACVVRARGWRARQAAGQATPGRLLAAAVPACLLPDARVCHFFFRECAWMYVCMHACMCVCIVCLGGRLSTPSSQTRTPCSPDCESKTPLYIPPQDSYMLPSSRNDCMYA